MHVDTTRLIMTQNLSTHTEPRSKLTIFLLLPRPFLLSLSPSPSGTSFQTSAHLSIQDSGVSARGSRQIRLPCMLKHRVQQEYNSLLVNALNHIFKSNLSLNNFKWLLVNTLNCIFKSNLSLNNFKWLLTKLKLSCVRNIIPRSRKRL